MCGMLVSLPEPLRKVIERFDERPDDFDEFDVACELEKAAKELGPLEDAALKVYRAEMNAFQFYASEHGETTMWGTHFGPIFMTELPDGTPHPPVTAVDHATLEHWEHRRDEAKHPVLRARYADLLWDLRRPATGARRDPGDARAAIRSYIEAADRAMEATVRENTHRLERALDLAIRIGDKGLVGTVRDAMFGFYERIGGPGDEGTSGWLFDRLYTSKKVPLTAEQEQRLIDELEAGLTEFTSGDDPARLHPFGAEAIAWRLRRHYERTGQIDEARRVVLAYGRAYVSWARQAHGLVAMAWLQKIHDAYRQVGLHAEAARLLLLYKQKGKEAEAQMTTLSVKVEIPTEELERAVDDLTNGNLHDVLCRLAVTFAPKMDDVRSLVDRIADSTTVLSRVSILRLAEQQIIAEIGPTEADEEGRLVNQMSQMIGLETPLLGCAIDAAREKFSFSAEEIVDFLLLGPAFDDQRASLIGEGIDAYLASDHVKAVHVLVPQIEYAMRRLLGLLRQPTSKRMASPKGVMQEKSLTDILEREPAVQALFRDNGVEGWLWYLRAFFTDPRGHNLRNRLAHGLMGPREFGRQVSTRVVHVLLMLSLVGRCPKTDDDDAREAEPGKPPTSCSASE